MELDIPKILRSAKLIAVVGASEKRLRESNKIFRYLIKEGYEVIPVNPMVEEVEGLKSYPRLQDIPAEFEIDIVNIFRRPEFVEDLVVDTINRCLDEGHKRPAVWTQLGVSSDSGELLASTFSLPYIKNRCILVEHGISTS